MARPISTRPIPTRPVARTTLLLLSLLAAAGLTSAAVLADGRMPTLRRAAVPPVPADARVLVGQRLRVGDRVRQYRLAVPSGIDAGKPVPVVFAYHGAGPDDMDFMPTYTGLDTLADERGFLLVYPNAVDGRTWALSPVRAREDVAFFDALLADLGKRFPIDRDRVYAVGMSNGAYFAHVLGLERSALLAAVVSHSGTLGAHAGRVGRAARDYPVLIVHGTADRVIPVAQARRTRDAYLKAGHEVEHVEVPGLGHRWAKQIDVNGKIADFLAAHPRP